MRRYIARRLLYTIIVLLIVSFYAVFLVNLMPGDPAIAMLGADASQEQLEALRKEMRLDEPLFSRYIYWLGNALQGNFGTSYNYHMDVLSLVAQRAKCTIHIGITALVLTVLIGIPLGIVSALKRGSVLDQIISVLTNIGMSAPRFWFAILGIYFFSYQLGILPISGYVGLDKGFLESTRSIILPSFMLALTPMTSILRQTRSAMLEVINQDYVRTARSKGLKSTHVITRHALKNAMIPIITQLGMQVRQVIGGTVIIEQVFNIPGMARLITLSVENRDIQVVQGSILLISIVVTLANLLVDISYAYFNPKIRYE
ncbi:MAG: ABC transporter permease [Clostridia bacterium]|nr:ABC transporter permease [Clostridia bacterium]